MDAEEQRQQRGHAGRRRGNGGGGRGGGRAGGARGGRNDGNAADAADANNGRPPAAAGRRRPGRPPGRRRIPRYEREGDALAREANYVRGWRARLSPEAIAEQRRQNRIREARRRALVREEEARAAQLNQQGVEGDGPDRSNLPPVHPARQRERERNQRRRADPVYADMERQQNNRRYHQQSAIHTDQQYQDAIKQGHTEECSCCKELVLAIKQFSKGVLRREHRLSNELLSILFDGQNVDDNEAAKIQLCASCQKEVLKKKQLPKLCEATFPLPKDIPPSVDELNRDEELLITPTQFPFLPVVSIPRVEDETTDFRHERNQWRTIYVIATENTDTAGASLTLPRPFDQKITIQVASRGEEGGTQPAVLKNTISPMVVDAALKAIKDRAVFRQFTINDNYLAGNPPPGREGEQHQQQQEPENMEVDGDEDENSGGDEEMQSNEEEEEEEEDEDMTYEEDDEEEEDEEGEDEEGEDEEEEEAEEADANQRARREPYNPDSLETLVLNRNDVLNIPSAEMANYRDLGQRLVPSLNRQLEALVLSNPNQEYYSFLKAYVAQPMQYTHPDVVLAEATGNEAAVRVAKEATKDQKKPSYSKLSKHELRHTDRRAVRPDHLFFKLLKLQSKTLNTMVNICLRQMPGGQQLRKNDALNKQFIGSLINEDQGFFMLHHCRNSLAYWKARKRDVMAMIRQLGSPTFFLTLSQAQTQWPELLVQLKKALDKEHITEEQAERLSYEEKAKLIRRDPVTCVLHFERRIRTLFRLLASPTGTPFGSEHQVEDYYVRVEFGSRSGVPHVHCLLWLKEGSGVPVYHNLDSARECVRLADQHISVAAHQEAPEGDALGELVRRFQVHTCDKFCLQVNAATRDEDGGDDGNLFAAENAAAAGGAVAVCRFGYPRPPMRKTVVLQRLPKSELTAELAERWQNIRDLLQNEDVISRLNFEQMLERLEIDEGQYLQAVRVSIRRREEMFLKRKPAEIWINPYNPHILQLHRANMDIQFVLAPHAVATYITKCANKAFSTGLSHFLSRLVVETRCGNYSARNRLNAILDHFYASAEYSVYEAVYQVMSIPVSMSSRTVIFINTNPPEKRTRRLKSRAELRQLDEGSTDVYMPNLLEYYAGRTGDELKGTCLATVAAWVEVKTVAAAPNAPAAAAAAAGEASTDEEVSSNDDDEGEEEEVSSDDDDEGEEEEAALAEGRGGAADGGSEQTHITGFLNKVHHRRATKPKVIRFCNYSKDKDPFNYYREQLLLYVPWPREEIDHIPANATLEDLEAKCNFYQSTISENSKLYTRRAPTYEDDEDEGEEEEEREEEQEQEQEEEGSEAEDEEAPVRPQRLYPNRDQLPDDVQGGQATAAAPLTRRDIDEIMASLNQKQRTIVLEVLRLLTIDAPFYIFISGGAGTGKSYLIKNLVKVINYHFLNRQQAGGGRGSAVTLCAPTGRAAFNIGGATVHSTFGLQVNTASGNAHCKHKLTRLDEGRMNAMRVALNSSRVLILDEASMIGNDMVNQINVRCNQLANQPDNTVLFGGKLSVIMVGDLYQLPPVRDSWIFAQSGRADDPSTLASTWLWSHFKYFELTQVERQQGDQTFVEALNKLRKGELKNERLQLFKDRVYDEQHTFPEDALHLFRDNASVDRYNETKLEELIRLGGEDHLRAENIAVDVIAGNSDAIYGKNNSWVAERKEMILTVVSNYHHSKTGWLQYRLNLVVGARYMVTANVATADGIVNGAIGRLKHFDVDTDHSGTERVKLLWMDFEEERVGRQQRQVFADRIREMREQGVRKEGDIWTPIKLKTEQFYKFNIGRARCTVIREQFPVVPAEAVTIYKAQGGTFSNVVLHLPNSSQPPCRLGELYVGCSRVRQFSSLYIVGAFPKKPPVDSEVKAEYDRLKLDENLLHEQLPMWTRDRLPTRHYRIVAHNVEGLTEQSWRSMMTDENFFRAQIILLTGTGNIVHHDWQSENFIVLEGSQIPANRDSKMGGSCIVIRKELKGLQCEVIDKYYHEVGDHSRSSGGRMEFTILKLQPEGHDPAYVVSVFKSPLYPLKEMLITLNMSISSEMRKARLLFVGDMGTDLMVLEERGGGGTDAEQLDNFLKNTLKLENLLENFYIFIYGQERDENLPTIPPTMPFTGKHVDLAFAKEAHNQNDMDNEIDNEMESENSTLSSDTAVLVANTYMSATSSHTPIFVLF